MGEVAELGPGGLATGFPVGGPVDGASVGVTGPGGLATGLEGVEDGCIDGCTDGCLDGWPVGEVAELSSGGLPLMGAAVGVRLGVPPELASGLTGAAVGVALGVPPETGTG